MRNRAFTLIELLVVIAIIALLSSIALPAYRAVQQKARMTQDANNLKQIGVGFAAYLGDNSDTMFSGSTATSGTTCWASMIGPGTASNYVSSTKVFQSPFDSRAFNATTANLSYAMNASIIKPPNDAGGVPITSVTSYSHPSALLVLGPCDTSVSGGSLKFANTMISDVTIAPSKVYSLMGSAGFSTTQGMVNVLFADWHVASVSMPNFNVSTTYQLWAPNSTASQ
jgi:prepilin-type N-terminal cleavage/methylation domain-containing protein/prepilin-type processing-associated H-X9-DG protein